MSTEEESTGREDPVFLVAAVIDGFLDEDLLGGWWDAHSLVVADSAMQDAVRAWATSRGGIVGDWTADESRVVDLMVVEARIRARDQERALTVAANRLTPLVYALSYRQLRPGRIVAWIAHPEQGGSTLVRHPYTDPPKVYHEPVDATWTPEGDVEAIADSISASPTGALFAGLFAEALADASPEGMVVRLWSLLEAMSRGFWSPDKTRKAQLKMVEKAMAHLGLGEGSRLADAYHLRNTFLHQGARADRTHIETVRASLVRLAFEALGRGGFQQVDPAAAPWQQGERPRVRRTIASASSPRPTGQRHAELDGSEP